jgi:hypothetical protein
MLAAGAPLGDERPKLESNLGFRVVSASKQLECHTVLEEVGATKWWSGL